SKARRATLDWNFTYAQLSSIYSPLMHLDVLLEEILALTSASSSAYDVAQLGALGNRGESEAWKEETASMRNLCALIKQAAEGVSFLMLLMDFKFLSFAGSLEEKWFKFFVDESFESLVTSQRGNDEGRAVFSRLVEVYIKQGTSIETVCDVARQRCPVFCGVDDVYLYKGLECLKKAKLESGLQFEDTVNEAAALFRSVAKSISFDRLVEIVNQFKTLHDYMHPITLLLSYAHIQDPTLLGLGHYLDGCPVSDQREVYYLKRVQCYDVARDTLLAVLSDELGGGEDQFDALIDSAFQLNDELFHYYVFDWFRSSQWIDKLLKLRSEFLERYLSEEPVTFDRADILWRFYVRKGAFFNSATVLDGIASSKANPITFVKRLEYLQLAVTHAKSSSTLVDPDRVREIEDKRDVGLIQLEIVNTMQKAGRLAEEDPINQTLLSISELFIHYARPFELNEVCLWILHTSEHKDVQLVQTLWNKIIASVVDMNVGGGDKAFLLQERVKAIGRKYYPDENVFPVAFLCSTLEAVVYTSRPPSASASSTESWVLAAMRAVGVPNLVLLQIYVDMWESKIAPWNTAAANRHLGNVIHGFVAEWVKSTGTSRAGR
ncbi:hypothetical protein HK405_008612, partial [Cladochytrium tenue]